MKTARQILIDAGVPEEELAKVDWSNCSLVVVNDITPPKRLEASPLYAVLLGSHRMLEAVGSKERMESMAEDMRKHFPGQKYTVVRLCAE